MFTGQSDAHAAAMVGYAIGAAGLYTTAMVAMKFWGTVPIIVSGGVIAIALLGAVGLEVMALRLDRMGMVYLAILVAETTLTLGVAHLAFGETFSAREATGAALIIAGVAIAAS
jgi:drug/metabolite transporter (DMT)-like permease